jgi:hypothetical protein
LNDPDFNKLNGVEGTGSDIVRYRISVNGYQGNIRAYATVYYQSLPPKWMEEIFADSTPEIETFRTMFNNADRSPVAVASAQTGNVYVDGVTAARESALQQAVSVFPNPAPDGKCQIRAEGLNMLGLRVFDAKGRWLKSLPAGSTEVSLPGRGVFLLEIKTDKGSLTKRVIAR